MSDYSPEMAAWQMLVAAALDDDAPDDLLDELDELGGMTVGAVLAGFGGELLRVLATATGTSVEQLVRELGPGMIQADPG